MFQAPWRRMAPLLTLALSMGCAHIPQQTESAKRLGFEASTTELRMRVVELGRETMRAIEMAADSIDMQTTDTGIRRNTLHWRISSLSAVTEAALRPTPVVATLDLLALDMQMARFVNSPAGDSSFGAYAPIARRAVAKLWDQWREATESTGGKLSDQDRARLDAWVRAHPIDRLPFTRTSLVGSLTEVLRDQETSIGAAVGGMQESLDRLEFRMSLLNENAIKESVWLARLSTLEVRQSPEVADLTSTVHSTRALLEDTPELIRSERLALMEEIDRQRLATLATLAQERAILLEAIAREREAALKSVDEQRQSVTRDADSMRVRMINDSFRIVDHLVLRIAELIAALMVVVGVGVLLMRGRSPLRRGQVP